MSLIDLYISDGGSIRRIGDNCHDMLTIEDGKLCYCNLQNGDGCRLGDDGEWYKFVDNVDEYGYNCDPRKTEPIVSEIPTSSEKPNSCTDCEHWTDTEDGCADRHGCKTTEDLQDWKDRMWAEAVVTEPTTEDSSMVEPQTEMPRCSVNGTPFDECGFCEYFNCDTCKCEADVPQTELKGSKRLLKGKDEPQTETEIARAIVHKMIDDAVIAEDAYPDLRQKMHDAVDNYEPQTERSSE